MAPQLGALAILTCQFQFGPHAISQLWNSPSVSLRYNQQNKLLLFVESVESRKALSLMEL